MSERVGEAMRGITLSLLMLCATGSVWATGWYRPPDQSFTALCRTAALAAHPGKVERIHVNATGPVYRVRIYIEQPDGREWIIFCNGMSGVIEKSILVDDL